MGRYSRHSSAVPVRNPHSGALKALPFLVQVVVFEVFGEEGD